MHEFYTMRSKACDWMSDSIICQKISVSLLCPPTRSLPVCWWKPESAKCFQAVLRWGCGFSTQGPAPLSTSQATESLTTPRDNLVMLGRFYTQGHRRRLGSWDYALPSGLVTPLFTSACPFLPTLTHLLKTLVTGAQWLAGIAFWNPYDESPGLQRSHQASSVQLLPQIWTALKSTHFS